MSLFERMRRHDDEEDEIAGSPMILRHYSRNKRPREHLFKIFAVALRQAIRRI